MALISVNQNMHLISKLLDQVNVLEIFISVHCKGWFLLRKIFRRNLNEAISTNEIALFRFPRKIFLKKKLTITLCTLIVNYTSSEYLYQKQLLISSFFRKHLHDKKVLLFRDDISLQLLVFWGEMLHLEIKITYFL